MLVESLQRQGDGFLAHSFADAQYEAKDLLDHLGVLRGTDRKEGSRGKCDGIGAALGSKCFFF